MEGKLYFNYVTLGFGTASGECGAGFRGRPEEGAAGGNYDEIAAAQKKRWAAYHKKLRRG